MPGGEELCVLGLAPPHHRTSLCGCLWRKENDLRELGLCLCQRFLLLFICVIMGRRRKVGMAVMFNSLFGLVYLLDLSDLRALSVGIR